MHSAPTSLEQTLEELDRLVHHSKDLLRRGQKTTATIPAMRAWGKAAGLWKGKIIENPLAYQQRIRSEEGI